jgi:hypothetical protein
VNLATVAAFAAATISLVNVFVTSRLTRRSQKEQWRRDTERPIVAALLTSSDDCLRAWTEAASQKETWARSLQPGGTRDDEARDKMTKAYAEGWALYEKLSLQLAELDLVAGVEVRRKAKELLDQHYSIRHVTRPAGGANNPSGFVGQCRGEIETLRGAVIAATRVDIGVDAGNVNARLRARLAIWSSKIAARQPKHLE